MVGVGMLLVSFTFLTFGFTSDYWGRDWYPAVLISPLLMVSMACATVSFFSLAMKISWTRAAATQFTLYMAMSNVGDAVGARLNNANYWLAKLDWGPLGNSGFYILAGSVALLPLLVLPFMNPNAVVDRKD